MLERAYGVMGPLLRRQEIRLDPLARPSVQLGEILPV
jgi:hypothetical protein